ncbi:GIN domain-containing protein [Psychroserpens sp.]|uniref:GIN domain-containing protein n=1 Tax=Psychroserpens sp. TaxID=2020870 RepID=UPI001B198CAF|nr:DUF2807 domain-containing protein [Psychroserpens sp.]MBO6607437.1 DUF2807 domain-containing protein [Psychroserpens sp.]MBO6654485.1 DUF2807 domain-containing protein [Psychroserpens sp.]MBO6681166.1 DUF2807 domain-containing protein [Psychroserpens sp.]MBO6749877.1 DUF2807 domain-containing protein [Psychroserpens sp.]MBO6916135.1 DUF2807 domain-containing protein [Psychroserpens sp.]
MKKLTVMFMLVGMASMAQIKGNGAIEKRQFEVNGLEYLKINLYAKITIDQSATEGMSITTDSNLFDHITTEVDEGMLNLNQKEWISASQPIVITIGAPNLYRLESGTHDVTKLINVNNELLKINAPIGNISVQGRTKELRIGSELATIDASKLIAENAFVNLWHYGTVKINVINTLWAEVSNDGKLIYTNNPKELKVKKRKGGKVLSASQNKQIKPSKTEYINFKIKNNSSNRNQFYVVGPKPDGSKFSYGFPMMPNSKRHENWTVGTKVYKVNSLGFKKLLVTIVKENENQVVDLFN